MNFNCDESERFYELNRNFGMHPDASLEMSSMEADMDDYYRKSEVGISEASVILENNAAVRNEDVAPQENQQAVSVKTENEQTVSVKKANQQTFSVNRRKISNKASASKPHIQLNRKITTMAPKRRIYNRFSQRRPIASQTLKVKESITKDTSDVTPKPIESTTMKLVSSTGFMATNSETKVESLTLPQSDSPQTFLNVNSIQKFNSHEKSDEKVEQFNDNLPKDKQDLLTAVNTDNLKNLTESEPINEELKKEDLPEVFENTSDKKEETVESSPQDTNMDKNQEDLIIKAITDLINSVNLDEKSKESLNEPEDLNLNEEGQPEKQPLAATKGEGDKELVETTVEDLPSDSITYQQNPSSVLENLKETLKKDEDLEDKIASLETQTMDMPSKLNQENSDLENESAIAVETKQESAEKNENASDDFDKKVNSDLKTENAALDEMKQESGEKLASQVSDFNANKEDLEQPLQQQDVLEEIKKEENDEKIENVPVEDELVKVEHNELNNEEKEAIQNSEDTETGNMDEKKNTEEKPENEDTLAQKEDLDTASDLNKDERKDEPQSVSLNPMPLHEMILKPLENGLSLNLDTKSDSIDTPEESDSSGTMSDSNKLTQIAFKDEIIALDEEMKQNSDEKNIEEFLEMNKGDYKKIGDVLLPHEIEDIKPIYHRFPEINANLLKAEVLSADVDDEPIVYDIPGKVAEGSSEQHTIEEAVEKHETDLKNTAEEESENKEMENVSLDLEKEKNTEMEKSIADMKEATNVEHGKINEEKKVEEKLAEESMDKDMSSAEGEKPLKEKLDEEHAIKDKLESEQLLEDSVSLAHLPETEKGNEEVNEKEKSIGEEFTPKEIENKEEQKEKLNEEAMDTKVEKAEDPLKNNQREDQKDETQQDKIESDQQAAEETMQMQPADSVNAKLKILTLEEDEMELIKDTKMMETDEIIQKNENNPHDEAEEKDQMAEETKRTQTDEMDQKVEMVRKDENLQKDEIVQTAGIIQKDDPLPQDEMQETKEVQPKPEMLQKDENLPNDIPIFSEIEKHPDTNSVVSVTLEKDTLINVDQHPTKQLENVEENDPLGEKPLKPDQIETTISEMMSRSFKGKMDPRKRRFLFKSDAR